MELNYKRKKGIRELWRNFMWKYDVLVFASMWIFSVVSILFVLIFISVYLSSDTTDKCEVTDIKKTTIIVKKKNGLSDSLIISSNGALEVEQMPLRPDILLIKENGKNGVGVSITMETRVENVDTFYVK
jgi:hypothetical protein